MPKKLTKFTFKFTKNTKTKAKIQGFAKKPEFYARECVLNGKKCENISKIQAKREFLLWKNVKLQEIEREMTRRSICGLRKTENSGKA